MATWTPIFSTLVDSSVWLESDLVCKVWVTMLALKNRDQVVPFNAFQLGRKCNKDEAEVLEALKVLSSPDTKRLEPQAFEGRRIEKVDGGWRILNGKFYEDHMRALNRRSYKAEKQAEYRKPANRGAEAAFVNAADERSQDQILDEERAAKEDSR